MVAPHAITCKQYLHMVGPTFLRKNQLFVGVFFFSLHYLSPPHQSHFLKNHIKIHIKIHIRENGRGKRVCGCGGETEKNMLIFVGCASGRFFSFFLFQAPQKALISLQNHFLHSRSFSFMCKKIKQKTLKT